MGTRQKPLQLVIRMLLEFKSTNLKELNMENEFDLSIDMNMIQLVLDLLIKIDKNALFQIPLRHVLNYNCWLATIIPSTLNQQQEGVNNNVNFDNKEQREYTIHKLQAFVKEA